MIKQSGEGGVKRRGGAEGVICMHHNKFMCVSTMFASTLSQI